MSTPSAAAVGDYDDELEFTDPRLVFDDPAGMFLPPICTSHLLFDRGVCSRRGDVNIRLSVSLDVSTVSSPVVSFARLLQSAICDADMSLPGTGTRTDAADEGDDCYGDASLTVNYRLRMREREHTTAVLDVEDTRLSVDSRIGSGGGRRSSHSGSRSTSRTASGDQVASPTSSLGGDVYGEEWVVDGTLHVAVAVNWSLRLAVVLESRTHQRRCSLYCRSRDPRAQHRRGVTRSRGHWR
jgi:hypothetical protein